LSYFKIPGVENIMSSSHTVLRYLRLTHLYIGVFIAPALLFFAFTGALQTFSLHETTRGSSYKPPAWAVMLAQIHKKQTPVVPVRKVLPPDKATTEKAAPETPQLPKPLAPSSAPTEAPKPTHNALPLKYFFLLVSIGLFVSTLSGLYMSYKYIRNRRLITTILLAGIIVPVLLTIF
jgi:hypothetical protein